MEIWAKILRISKNLPAPTPMRLYAATNVLMKLKHTSAHRALRVVVRNQERNLPIAPLTVPNRRNTFRKVSQHKYARLPVNGNVSVRYKSNSEVSNAVVL